MLFFAPDGGWARVWPINVALLAVSSLPGGYRLVGEWLPNSLDRNPRGEGLSWEASRVLPVSARETYVLVIGESIRSDYLNECGGAHGVRALNHDFLVACDVTAGADATHTSVPLLISRDMPGGRFRVPRDGSFVRAFKETGFDTYWFGMHGPAVAWPDAEHQLYPDGGALDRRQLLPLLERALSNPVARRMIVLHANNAHAPYCARYEPGAAPNRVDCNTLSGLPEMGTLAIWRGAYANAVDESVRFLNAVRTALTKVDGAVFLVFSPDHGENLMDDSRRLYQHALRYPSRWDIQVPAVFWANDVWRSANPQRWSQLQANTASPLMHADLVPTLLGAAGIHYADARKTVVDLTVQAVFARKRTIQTSLGASTDWDILVRQAQP